MLSELQGTNPTHRKVPNNVPSSQSLDTKVSNDIDHPSNPSSLLLGGPLVEVLACHLAGDVEAVLFRGYHVEPAFLPRRSRRLREHPDVLVGLSVVESQQALPGPVADFLDLAIL